MVFGRCDPYQAVRAFDPVDLARMESAAWIGDYRREWGRVHRALQHESGGDIADLGEAVATLYANTYDVPIDSVRESGRWRADAMEICDRLVASGCDLGDPLVAGMRRSLLRSYRSLKAAVS